MVAPLLHASPLICLIHFSSHTREIWWNLKKFARVNERRYNQIQVQSDSCASLGPLRSGRHRQRSFGQSPPVERSIPGTRPQLNQKCCDIQTSEGCKVQTVCNMNQIESIVIIRVQYHTVTHTISISGHCGQHKIFSRGASLYIGGSTTWPGASRPDYGLTVHWTWSSRE